MASPPKPIFQDVDSDDLFQKINDICAVVDFVEDTDKLFEITLRKIMAFFKAGRGSIFTFKKNGNELVLAAAVGMPRKEGDDLVKRMSNSITAKVALEKRPIVVEDIGQDVRFKNFKPRRSYATPSFICVPLMAKDELLGVINIADKESGLRFTPNEMRLLDFLSSQIALNYKRILLYERLQKSMFEAKSLKDQLGRSDERAEHLKRQVYIQEKLATLGKLAGGIAHEFNNPLDGVMRYTNLSLEHTQDEMVRGYLLEVKHGLDRMANIVKNLLACTRNQTIASERTDFPKALEGALGAVRAEIAQRNIQVKTEIQENIPSLLDLGLEGILTNLIRNAADAIDHGGAITVEAKCTDNILTVMVSDTGKGIPLGDPEQIFEPFFTTKDMDKGCGLGLTIVAEIVKNYEGKIFVTSKPGKGTVFTVHLPVK